MEPKNVFYLDLSPRLREVFEPFIDKWLPVLPSWCTELTVREGAGNSDVLASFSINPSYRRASLLLWPIAAAHHNPDELILHEFCHAYTSPCALVIRQFLEDRKIEGVEAETLCRRITDYEEGATVDLVNFLKRFGAPVMISQGIVPE